MAQNYERIHRSNLIGMGILPALFQEGESHESLGLSGEESFAIDGLHAAIRTGDPIRVTATAPDGSEIRFSLTADLHGADERALLAAGGIFPRLFDRLLAPVS